jgi:hypothetical protein
MSSLNELAVTYPRLKTIYTLHAFFFDTIETWIYLYWQNLMTAEEPDKLCLQTSLAAI